MDEIFGPARKHIHEHKDWIAVAELDDRESGDDPLVDLESGTVVLSSRRPEPDVSWPRPPEPNSPRAVVARSPG